MGELEKATRAFISLDGDRWQEVPGIYAYEREKKECFGGCSYIPSREQRWCCRKPTHSQRPITVEKSNHSHKNLKRSVLPKLFCSPSICVKNFWTSSPDILPAQQLMHRRARGVHGIEDDEATSTVAAAFKTNNGDRMTGLLKIDGW